MRRTNALIVIIGTVLAAASYSSSSIRAQQPAGRTLLSGIYAPEQAKRGEALYAKTCARCHDPKLIGDMGPALAGNDFLTAWKEKSVGDLFETIKTTMPLNAPGTLTEADTADTVAFILSFNQFPAGTELPADPAPLKSVSFATSGAAPAGGAAAPAAGAAAPAGGALFAEAQAKRGEAIYTESCAACHDAKLVGGIGPALTGDDFLSVWKDKSVGELFERIKTTMPMTSPGTLTPQQTADIVAHILSVGRYPAGATELGTDEAALRAVTIGAPPQK